MVESKLVELVVAGSNPVGHPIFAGGENAAPNPAKREKAGKTATLRATAQQARPPSFVISD